MKKTFILLLVIFWVSGCDTIENVSSTYESTDLAENMLKDEYGLDANVTFNIKNDILKSVMVTFDASKVRDRSVLELEAAVSKVIKEAFKSKPESLHILLIANGIEK